MASDFKPTKSTKLRLSLLLIFSVLFSISCTQNIAEIKTATPTIIFDYYSTDSTPVSRLSIFVESTSEVKRSELIRLQCKSTGYTWDINDLIRFKFAEKMYAGSNNLILPEGERVPDGEYTLLYQNADLEKAETVVKLEYDPVFYETTAAELPALMRQKFGKKYIAIYDKNDQMIFYGERTEQLGDTRKIWNKYRNASYFNEVWTLANNSVMCILPVEYVLPSQE